MISSWAHLDDGTYLQHPGRERYGEILAGEGNLLWIDLEDPKPDEIAILRDEFRFHPLLIDDCIASHSQPKIDEFDDYFFLVIHSVFFYAEKRMEEALSIRELDIFVGRNYVITHHQGHIRSVSTNRKRCEQGSHIMGRGADYLFYNMLDALVDNYFPILDILGERLEGIEEEILKEPKPDVLAKIFAAKRNLLTMRKIVGPQREIIGRFMRPGFPFIRAEMRPYFKDVYDHILRIYDISESSRDLISADMEAYLSSISFKLNEIMKTLTIIATFVMPLTLITGFYGMNVEIPEFRWGVWGYLTAWVFIILSSVGMFLYFKRKKLI
ncbi:MAG: magnesium/cobalt transporter CorA [bacterium]|nr:magnesium/cobalt transporter CorA [bacterium]